MEQYQADILIDQRHALGEGPVWDKKTSTLYYVDIMGNALHSVNLPTGRRDVISLTQNIGCFALRESGGFIMGLAAGVYLRNADGTEIHKLPTPDFDPRTRANDGKCDPAGRFFCGTSDQVDGIQQSRLYVITPDGRCAQLLDGLSCANGLAFRDNLVYFIDSPRHCVECYSFDPDRLTLSERRIAVPIDPAHGLPDGMTMDTDGMLWVAHWGGGFVGRYDPSTGRLLARVTIPASQCTSCCFGGSDMQTLFITSAATGREGEPHAGKVFCVRLPYQGEKTFRFPG